MFTGLSTASGKVEVTQDVDPAGANPAALLQRTGLAVDEAGSCSAWAGTTGTALGTEAA